LDQQITQYYVKDYTINYEVQQELP